MYLELLYKDEIKKYFIYEYKMITIKYKINHNIKEYRIQYEFIEIYILLLRNIENISRTHNLKEQQHITDLIKMPQWLEDRDIQGLIGKLKLLEGIILYTT